MAYATAAEFITAFGEDEWLQLTDRDRDDSTDTGVGAAALDDASGIVDGYTRAIYAVPLSVVDSVVRQITLDIARWLLAGNQASEQITYRYEEAIKRLKDIAAQKLVLSAALLAAGDVDTSITNDDGTTGYSSPGLAYSIPSRVFTRQPAMKP